MKLQWTHEAIREMGLIAEYIARDNPVAATTVVDQIFLTTEKMLSDNPLIGRPGRIAGTRELVVHASYLIAYQVTEKVIEVLTVRHAARLWPEILK